MHTAAEGGTSCPHHALQVPKEALVQPHSRAGTLPSQGLVSFSEVEARALVLNAGIQIRIIYSCAF